MRAPSEGCLVYDHLSLLELVARHYAAEALTILSSLREAAYPASLGSASYKIMFARQCS